MKISDRYHKHAMSLLRKHKLTHVECDARWSRAVFCYRTIHAPKPINAMSFYVFAHEVAHHVFGDHKYDDRTGIAEIEADLWALEQLRHVRGYVPLTVHRKVHSRAAALISHAIRYDYLSLDRLVQALTARR